MLRLYGNGKLAGRMCGELWALPGQLRELTLGDPGGSALTSTLPAFDDYCLNLTTLIVDHAAISGTIPAAFGANAALNTISMDHNRLSGPQPLDAAALGQPPLWHGAGSEGRQYALCAGPQPVRVHADERDKRSATPRACHPDSTSCREAAPQRRRIRMGCRWRAAREAERAGRAQGDQAQRVASGGAPPNRHGTTAWFNFRGPSGLGA